MNAKPKSFVYEKPGDAGQKPGNAGKNKRRIRLPEPTMFSDRVSKDSTNLPSEPMVAPIKVRKIKETEDGEVKYFFIMFTAAFAGGEISVKPFFDSQTIHFGYLMKSTDTEIYVTNSPIIQDIIRFHVYKIFSP